MKFRGIGGRWHWRGYRRRRTRLLDWLDAVAIGWLRRRGRLGKMGVYTADAEREFEVIQ